MRRYANVAAAVYNMLSFKSELNRMYAEGRCTSKKDGTGFQKDVPALLFTYVIKYISVLVALILVGAVLFLYIFVLLTSQLQCSWRGWELREKVYVAA